MGLARRLIAVCLSLLVIVALLGCGGDAQRTEALPSWTLAFAGAPPKEVTLPTHLDLPDARMRYELQTTVPVPPAWRGHELGLIMPYFAGRAALRVGDRPLVQIDAPLRDGYRGTGAQAWRIPAALTAGDQLAVVIEVEHRWTASAWLDCVPRIGPAADVERSLLGRRLVHDLGAMAAVATLLIIGFTYLVIFLFDRRRASHGWFSLGMMTAGYYPLWILGWTQPLFGTYDVAVLGLVLVVAPVASIHFLHVEFGLGPTPLAVWLLVAAAVITAMFANQPFECALTLGAVTIGADVLAILYHFWTLGRLSRARPRPVNARTFLLCWVVLAVVIWNDFIGWLGLGEPAGGVRLGGWGLAVFAMLYSVALSRQHILAQHRAESLNVELAERVGLLEARQQEIQLLNDELRRQIAERSRDLSTVVQRMAEVVRPTRSLVPGQLVADRYRLVREIGSGGMGTVYEVVRETDGCRLAMKVIKGAPDRLTLARFAREAEIVARIDHPNVIRIHDVGISAQDDMIYLVMELVEGASLARSATPCAVDWALEVLRQTCEGLAAIHAHNFVHRDIKPANVLLRESRAGQPIVKITDFGIAALRPADDLQTRDERSPASSTGGQRPLTGTLTHAGALLGTPPYLAPELTSAARRATPASDVFALGIMAHELLTGLRAFDEPPFLSAMRGRFRPARSLEATAPMVDVEVAVLLDRCLLQDPQERPSAAELARALAGICRAAAAV